MNSTRKIEGYLTAHDANGPGYELGSGAGFGSFWEGDPTKFLPDALPVTLIIGGKGYTVEEVAVMLEEVLSAPVTFGETTRMTASRIAAKHGITIP